MQTFEELMQTVVELAARVEKLERKAAQKNAPAAAQKNAVTAPQEKEAGK